MFNTPDGAEFIGINSDREYGLAKAKKGTPEYDKWLEAYRAKRGKKSENTEDAKKVLSKKTESKESKQALLDAVKQGKSSFEFKGKEITIERFHADWKNKDMISFGVKGTHIRETCEVSEIDKGTSKIISRVNSLLKHDEKMASDSPERVMARRKSEMLDYQKEHRNEVLRSKEVKDLVEIALSGKEGKFEIGGHTYNIAKIGEGSRDEYGGTTYDSYRITSDLEGNEGLPQGINTSLTFAINHKSKEGGSWKSEERSWAKGAVGPLVLAAKAFDATAKGNANSKLVSD